MNGSISNGKGTDVSVNELGSSLGGYLLARQGLFAVKPLFTLTTNMLDTVVWYPAC